MNDLDSLNPGKTTHVPYPAAPVMAVIDGHRIDRDTLRCRMCGMTWSEVVRDPAKACSGNPGGHRDA